MKLSSLLFAFFLLFTFSCQTETKTVENVVEDPTSKVFSDGDARDSKAIISALSSEDPAVIIAAAQVAASMKKKSHLSALLSIIAKDSVPTEVVDAALFAIGQIGEESALSDLEVALKGDQLGESNEEVLEAIGKIGGDKAKEILLSNRDLKGLAKGLFRLAAKGDADVQVVERALSLVGSSEAETRLYAAHVLLRQNGIDLSPHLERMQEVIQSEKDGHVKGALLGALKHSVGSIKQALIVEELKGRPDDRTIVKAIRALGQEDFLSTYAYILPHLTDKNYHSAITSAKYLDRHFVDALVDHYLSTLDSVHHTEVQATMLGSLAREGNVEAKSRLQEMATDTTDWYTAVYALQNLGNNRDEYAMLQGIFQNEKMGILRGHAFEALLRLEDDQSRSYSGDIQYALESGDIALTCLAAAHLRNDRFIISRIPFKEWLSSAKTNLSLPRESEALVEINKTLAFLNETEFEMPEIVISGPKETEAVERTSRPIVRIITTKGTIRMELRPDKAPMSVAAIMQLVRDGYYNGKSFHRVVPDFVAQGGCPRGDGWGSLDFNLRSELSSLNYEEGTVGLASAGNDTEGCQFFITHSPTPHLDGRYTIIGQVVEGMEIVKLLTVGDEMQRLMIE